MSQKLKTVRDFAFRYDLAGELGLGFQSFPMKIIFSGFYLVAYVSIGQQLNSTELVGIWSPIVMYSLLPFVTIMQWRHGYGENGEALLDSPEFSHLREAAESAGDRFEGVRCRASFAALLNPFTRARAITRILPILVGVGTSAYWFEDSFLHRIVRNYFKK